MKLINTNVKIPKKYQHMIAEIEYCELDGFYVVTLEMGYIMGTFSFISYTQKELLEDVRNIIVNEKEDERITNERATEVNENLEVGDTVEHIEMKERGKITEVSGNFYSVQWDESRCNHVEIIHKKYIKRYLESKVLSKL